MITGRELVKIELMTYGMGVSTAAKRAMGRENKPLTLADYASTSGITMKLEGDIFVNAPISDYNPNFVRESPYCLDFKEDKFFISSADGLEIRVEPFVEPAYYEQTNQHGTKYTLLVNTHTDRARISPIEGCAITCKFCDLPYDSKYLKKGVEEQVEALHRALTDPLQSARHILISGGTPTVEDYGYMNEVYRAVSIAFPNIPTDIMMVPMPGLLDLTTLRGIGIHGLAINLELFNQDVARRIMPAKWKLSREEYLSFIERAVGIFGQGKVRSLLMVGIESMEDTINGVRVLAERGCDTVLSPFRPDPATPMKGEKPPTVEFLIETYIRAQEIVEQYEGVKLGPRCIPCMHNTLTFPDGSIAYNYS